MISANGTGRLVQDPQLTEVETANKTTVVCNFTLAVDEFRSAGNGEKVKNTSFFDFEAWDSGGRSIAERARKGDTIAFKARPRQNTWMSGEERRSKIVFRLEEFQVFNRNRDDE